LQEELLWPLFVRLCFHGSESFAEYQVSRLVGAVAVAAAVRLSVEEEMDSSLQVAVAGLVARRRRDQMDFLPFSYLFSRQYFYQSTQARSLLFHSILDAGNIFPSLALYFPGKRKILPLSTFKVEFYVVN
jgi:hypothetical protein